MRCCVVTLVFLGMALVGTRAVAQEAEGPPKVQGAKSEPQYDDTFSGSILEVSAVSLTVSRSILGKPAEKRTFAIKADTRVEGKLRVRTRVTVGFVTAEEGDVARLIVVRQSSSQKK